MTVHENPIPIYRNDDNELLGFAAKTTDGWVALTLFLSPFGHFSSQQDAIQSVKEKGLSILTERWEYYDNLSQEWLDCMIVEAAKDSVKVAPFDGFYPDMSQIYTVHNPSQHLRKS